MFEELKCLDTCSCGRILWMWWCAFGFLTSVRFLDQTRDYHHVKECAAQNWSAN